MKSLINLNSFGATFGIEGEIVPIAPPLSTHLLLQTLCVIIRL